MFFVFVVLLVAAAFNQGNATMCPCLNQNDTMGLQANTVSAIQLYLGQISCDPPTQCLDQSELLNEILREIVSLIDHFQTQLHQLDEIEAVRQSDGG
ncbi:unnamed protein product [Cyprideis torosa]|uniref:Uncharacterized protein n=1 Tax=Cyprideis torosa TaxID=163714 RepID=A0A7R8WQL8_9CRUS|nr:unnamed protein product [Cyprideis torosa]CAG0908058.1 unnamed protein product [Cyprideis torosa]